MIGKIISGFGMGEDGQAPPIDDGPLRKLPKPLPGDRELAASPWVRPDRTLVEAADCNPEQCLRIPGQRLSCTQLIGIEIDVGMEVSEVLHSTKIGRHARLSSGAGVQLFFSKATVILSGTSSDTSGTP